jgi:hypothetical protein
MLGAPVPWNPGCSRASAPSQTEVWIPGVARLVPARASSRLLAAAPERAKSARMIADRLANSERIR